MTNTPRDGARLIGSALRAQWGGLAIGISVGLLWTAAKVASPLLVQEAVDEGITPRDLEAVRFWAIMLAIMAVIAAMFTGLRRYWAFRQARRVEAGLRDRVFAHVQRLHFGFHDRVQTGDLLSRANTDLQQIQFSVVLIPLTISNAVTVLAVTVILLTVDPLLTLVALGALPLLNVLGTRFSRRLHPEVMAVQRESAELASVVEETVSGVRVIKGFGADEVQANRLCAEADDLYDASIRATKVRARFLPAMEVLPNVGLIAVLGVGGHQVLSGSLTLGQLMAFTVYITLLIWPLRMLGMIIAQAQRSIAAAQRVQEVLSSDPDIADPAHPVALPARSGDGIAAGEVRFENVRFSYGDDQPLVLDGLDLGIAAGESVALVGATGSGKSTIARLLPRFYDADSGRVCIDGVNVCDLALDELRAAVGLVFEDTFLFSDTIAANIAFSNPEADASEIERASLLSGAAEFIEDMPDGYDTLVGERGFSLSGGQRQRIAIARAILADPRVLILDDATSAVDPSKEHEIRAAMGEVMAGRTTLVIAHRPATIALADRVVLIDSGQVAASGSHEQLLADSPAYRRVLAREVDHVA